MPLSDHGIYLGPTSSTCYLLLNPLKEHQKIMMYCESSQEPLTTSTVADQFSVKYANEVMIFKNFANFSQEVVRSNFFFRDIAGWNNQLTDPSLQQ